MSSNCEGTVSHVCIDEHECFEKLTLAVWRARPTLAALARRAGMAMAAERSPFMMMVEVGECWLGICSDGVSWGLCGWDHIVGRRRERLYTYQHGKTMRFRMP
jgi:hypothetical protein